MTWSYDSTDLDTATASGRLNVVRFLLGDTDSSDEQLQDEEIAFLLSDNSDDVYAAAADAAKGIAAKYSRLVTTELDGQLTLEYGELADKYWSLASDLSDKATSNAVGYRIIMGGTDFKPRIRRDKWRNPPYWESPAGYPEDD